MSKEEIAALLRSLGYDERIRGESLTLQDFARLCDGVSADTKA